MGDQSMNTISMKVGIKGYMTKMEAWTPIYAENGITIIGEVEGSRRQLAEFSPNVILLSGMAIMSDRSDWFNWCQVGLSDDPPVNTQTSLQAWLIGTNQFAPVPTATGAPAVAPFYGFKEKVFRFPALTGSNQILKEVGVGWGDGSGGADEIISRALIVDINGNTIAPSWKVGELLDVTYQLRYYPPLADDMGNIVLNGIGYDYILKAAEATSTSAWASNIGAAIGQVSLFNTDWQSYDGDISADVDGSPAGLTAACDNADQFNVPVGSPAYTVGVATNCGITGWNLGLGIRSLRIKTTAGNYQIQFDADGTGGSTVGDRIPKDTDFTMDFQFDLTWAEGTIPP